MYNNICKEMGVTKSINFVFINVVALTGYRLDRAPHKHLMAERNREKLRRDLIQVIVEWYDWFRLAIHTKEANLL